MRFKLDENLPVELAAALRVDSAGLVSDEDTSAIWAPDWERRYVEFLNSCGVS